MPYTEVKHAAMLVSQNAGNFTEMLIGTTRAAGAILHVRKKNPRNKLGLTTMKDGLEEQKALYSLKKNGPISLHTYL